MFKEYFLVKKFKIYFYLILILLINCTIKEIKDFVFLYLKYLNILHLI